MNTKDDKVRLGTSSETQKQIVGSRGSRSGFRSCKLGRFDFLTQLFCPWVSEDGLGINWTSSRKPFSSQSLRSYWPAAGIESSGSNHYARTKEITEFWLSGSLRIRIYGACLKWLLQSSRFLRQARRIVGSGDENARKPKCKSAGQRWMTALNLATKNIYNRGHIKTNEK